MTTALLLLIKVAMYGLILAIGMGSTLADLLYLWERPALLLRSLFAMYIAVPLGSCLLVWMLPVAPGVKAALLVLAVSAGAPLMLRKLGAFKNSAYVFSLVVTSSLLAIITVPAWVAFLAWSFDVAESLSPLAVGVVVAKAFLLPLVAGMALAAMAPAFCRYVADRLLGVAGILLIGAGLTLLALQWRVYLDMHWQGLVALLILLLVALAIGHAFGGPDPDDRTALAIACATRHVGIAIIVATAFRGPRTLLLLVAYITVATAVSVPYLQWRRRATRVGGAASRAASLP